MTKYASRYYLQYGAPGTEYNVYATGVYTADDPLGPFTYAPYNPVAYKPGGFVQGAGHGNTFQDVHGNWWNTGTPWVAVNWNFERRIGLHPAGFDADGGLDGVGPALAESFSGALPAMAAAAVDDPVHAAGRGVGLGGHDLLNEPAERLDPGLLLTATEQSALGVMYVERGEVGKGAMALILELMKATASRAGRDRVMSTMSCSIWCVRCSVFPIAM